MLTLKLLRERPEFVTERLAVKHFDAGTIVNEILDIDRRRRANQVELDSCLSRQKAAASKIGMLMKNGQKAEAEEAKAEVAALKARSAELEEADAELRQSQDALLVLLPNLPSDIVPEGRTAEDNVTVKSGGPAPALPDGALPHWEIVKNLDIIDFDLITRFNN